MRRGKALRGINIFEKKFAFIPIYGALHWSLCVIVNAGGLVKESPLFNEEQSEESEASFILVLDSYKLHDCNRIAHNVRKLLNKEYKEIYDYDGKNVFTKKTLKVIEPKGMCCHQYNVQ